MLIAAAAAAAVDVGDRAHRLFAHVHFAAATTRLGVGTLEHEQLLVLAVAALLLVLHASILEPDLHLTLGQLQVGRDLDATRPTQVLVRHELVLQLHQLIVRVRRAYAPDAGVESLRMTATCRKCRLVRF